MQFLMLLQSAGPASNIGGVLLLLGVIAVVALVIAVVVLFGRMQSLSSRIDELLDQVSKVSREAAVAVQVPVPVAVPVPAAIPVTAPQAVAVEQSGGGLPDGHLIAIVTAAAVAALGKPVVVRRLTFLNQNTVSGWAEAGRLMIQTSHNMRRKA